MATPRNPIGSPRGMGAMSLIKCEPNSNLLRQPLISAYQSSLFADVCSISLHPTHHEPTYLCHVTADVLDGRDLPE
jgi:hypothetical protein